MEQLRAKSKRALTLFLAIVMILTSLPLDVLAQGGQDNPKDKKINYDENPISDSGFKEGYINNKDIDVKVAKPTDGSKKFIEGPDIPDIYTMRAEYRIQRGDTKINNYQPYEASVGASIKEEDKKKIEQTINLPDFDGYTTPTPSFDVNYKSIVNKAKEGKKLEKKEGTKTWTEYKGVLPYIYTGKKNTLTVKHIFQSLEDKNKYGPIDGKTEIKTTTETGLTGSIVTISPLEKEEIKGYEPETSVIETQMPENTEKYVVEYRYNRKHFDVHYDTKEGTPIPTRTIYYGQRIPTIPLLGKDGKPTTDKTADPTYKLGSTFQGWKPSQDLEGVGGKKYKKDEIIKDDSGNPIKNLDAKFIMPAEDVTFTADWKDKEKADYAVQFWTEKADHADGASLLDKYDYMGTRVYKDQLTGSRPNLDLESPGPVTYTYGEEPKKVTLPGLKFPDLNQARLDKIWAGARFNRGQYLYLNKFFVYNKELTKEQNRDPKTNVTKTISATGQTVYNIYYDRQVYDLYFTKSNAQPDKNTFYPEIWKYDEKQGEVVMAGGPGKPYHYKARFNEMMYKWPNDAKQTKGFTSGYQSFGWGPNYAAPNWPLYLDTPPYRLNADEFLDMANYTNWGGYVKEIDGGNGVKIPASDFTTLSFGIKQDTPSIPHHMDFWMDGFKDGETIIRYDLVRTKADTASKTYGHKYPKVTGFTPYGYDPQSAWPVIREGSVEDGRVDGDRIDELNDEREEITPNTSGTYYNNYGAKLSIGQLDFIPAFFSDADPWGDPLGGEESAFKENGYLQFHYKRNKYPLRFNFDPTKIKDDSEFNKTNSLETFYEFPLKVLSPELVDSNLERDEKEYFKEDPKNLIDNPENLQKLGLTDLVYTDPTDNKLKVKRPDNLPEQMVFKGWALDPAGTKLIWENPKETMPFHPVNLYAKWAEPDFKWKVTIDPNGGSLSSIKSEDLTKISKTIQEGDIGQEEKKTYPEKKPNDGKKQIFTVIQRQQLNELEEPKRWGYDFLGWEWVRHNADGTEDKTYFNDYKVPELYSFGNDVVSDVYLRAIWVRNDLQTVMAYHHILDKDLKEVAGSPESQELPKRRKGYFAAALGSKQGAEYTLVPKAQWKDLKQKNKTFENYYDESTGRTNNYFQVHEIKGPVEEKQQDGTTKELNNKENDFHFFYIPYRKREYKVNYLDERCRANVEKFIAEAKKNFETNYEAIKNDSNKTEDQKREAYRDLVKKNSEDFEKIVSKYSIIDAETVINGKRHYDARNYRHIPGWTLADNESPQQQLFFDVDESTNEFLGINGTGLGEIFFFYQDARVIEVKNPNDPVPDGYVRVTFKIDDEKKGGVFKDKDNNEVIELHYDVIKGLKSDSLPVPGELGTKADGSPNDKEERKYYITPDNGKNFLRWDNKPLLNKGTILQTADKDYYVFTAYFDWSGLSVKAEGLVRTEAYKDPNNKWTNDFAPKLDDLKKQLVWKEKNEEKPIPDGTKIEFFYKDEAGKETKLNTDKDVFNLVKEIGKEDKDEVVRVVNIVAKVTFKDGKQTQELSIPITVYKNRYEALNREWQKPKYLSDAEAKDAKDGGLRDITGNYVKVTVSPSGDMKAKDNKVYYVNPKAWVEIPEVKSDGSSTFINWTADKKEQNEESKENGKFDFAKRHKFTEDTVITPVDAKEVVEQTDPNKKPDVPNGYVKVIVKTTEKATDETKFEKTFWVNPTKEVTIPVASPTGKTDQEVDIPKLGKKKVNYVFKEWQKVKTGEADDSLTDVTPAVKIELASHKYTDKVTVIEAAYKKSIQAEPIVKPLKTTKLDTPQGKEITDEILKEKITPQEGKEIKSIQVINRPDPLKPGEQKATVIVTYTDGTTQGTNDNPVEIPVEVHKNIIPEAPGGQRPKDAMDNYVKVIFKAGEGGTVSGDLVYYVSPEVEVNMTDSADKITKIPNVGYTSNGGTWSPEIKAEKITAEKTYEFNFVKSKDIVEKTDENTKKPEGYITVKLIPTDKATDATKKVYFVNPKAKDVTITNKPEGKKEKVNNIEQTYNFKGWKVTKGTVASWDNENITGTFIQDTEITAQYSTNVVPGELVPAPVAKKNVVTPKGDTPKPEDLIENKTGLPDGTTFKYTDDGTPDVNNPGKTTAKVEVKYPNGKTVVVEVPITVVDHVVSQIGGENGDKPLVPDTYVKVTVDTTDTATDNTYFVNVFWVKPNEEVWIPVNNPRGKEALENGVKKTNKFVKWVSDDSNKEYANTIRDTFTKATKITATYEQDKNVEPVGKNDQWIPQGSNPSPKDFINNLYNDDDPDNKNNLPSGTKFKFVDGFTPDTSKQGKDKTTKVEITYPNGEVKEVPVTYNVTGDVVEQPDPNDPTTKPVVPDDFVKVVVKTTEDGIEKATDETKFERTFWVNPTKVVTIPVDNPTGKEVKKLDGTIDYTWLFAGWDKELTKKFTEEQTTITAKYRKDYGELPEIKPIPEARGGFIYTDLGQPVTNEQYKSQIQLPDEYSFNTGTTFGIVPGTEPNINKTGLYSVKAWVTYPDGSGQEVTILVYVGEARVVPQPLPQPGGTGYNAIYIEKKVEVPAKIKPLHKEVRYMQGFNGYFRPNDGLTRAEAAQILANALREDGYNYNPNYQISYKDIGREWYTEAVRITTEANVFAGYDDGFFRPEKKITRAEWVATLRRFQNIAKADGNHMNLSGNHWAKGEIEGAFNEGWLKIYTDGLAKFNADEFIPRQEVAAVSNRAFNRVFDKTYIDRNDKAFINQYKDVNQSMWAYEDILCASNTFVHDEQLYRAHDVKNDKITFNVNLDKIEMLQDKFQRNPR
ncbi:MAG: Rib/alpha-like domain-containing protein [Peptoniphilus duerdenii]|uniref:Rib/alpha-like domain-containing protein n=2 Tax=Peptoniphilus duerdenii TaxID=507750 RepID=UPI00254FF1E7|nr:Rib/alpha-like domain-containing protein [Peptoniphilus duerdenii]MDK8275880.1 Rib/alpha-like domain-containing protein [Peptoniphilus duerdenii]